MPLAYFSRRSGWVKECGKGRKRRSKCWILDSRNNSEAALGWIPSYLSYVELCHSACAGVRGEKIEVLFL